MILKPLRSLTVFLTLVLTVQAQQATQAPPPQTPTETPAQTPATETLPAQTPPEDARDRVMYSSETERFWPLTKKLVRNTIMDQKDIWTSPFRMDRGDAKWWLLFGAGTAALIATDRKTSRWLPNTNDQASFSRQVSQPGAAYTLYPIAAGFYLVGNLAGSAKSREVGALGIEALTDSLILVTVLKEISRRERPEDNQGKGRFFVGGTSFPSGHSIMGWSLASVIAHEYHKTPLVPITVYGLATLVSVSRFSARKHFASDILAGGAMGWFIGRYVYRTHVDHSIHKAPIASLRPEIVPIMEPANRTFAVSLRWNLGNNR